VVETEREDGSLHGLWVRWETVKEQLIDEIYSNLGIGSLTGMATSGSADGFTLPDGSVSTTSSGVLSPIMEAVKQALSSLGLAIENGIATVKGLFAEKVQTNELCVGQTCLNEEQLKQVLQTINNPTPTETPTETINGQPVENPLPSEYCDNLHPNLCTDDVMCRDVGLYWHEGACWIEPESEPEPTPELLPEPTPEPQPLPEPQPSPEPILETTSQSSGETIL